MNFKTITGGTEAEALAKFPWLNDASFEDAIVDITHYYLVWEGGTWEGGTWKDGTWEDGIWERGIWKDGIWEDGIWKRGIWKDGTWEGGLWEDGLMWSNIHQEYKRVAYEDGKFTVAE